MVIQITKIITLQIRYMPNPLNFVTSYNSHFRVNNEYRQTEGQTD